MRQDGYNSVIPLLVLLKGELVSRRYVGVLRMQERVEQAEFPKGSTTYTSLS